MTVVVMPLGARSLVLSFNRHWPRPNYALDVWWLGGGYQPHAHNDNLRIRSV